MDAVFGPKYVPCIVDKKISRLVYSLKNMDGSDAGKWHVKDMKPYFGSNPELTVV
jgi:hypothetical protein